MGVLMVLRPTNDDKNDSVPTPSRKRERPSLAFCSLPFNLFFTGVPRLSCGS
jgi:hypothetical protein